MKYNEPAYQNRADAGSILADHLMSYQGSNTIAFAIPRGGIPVAVEVARGLGTSLDIIISCARYPYLASGHDYFTQTIHCI